MDKLILTYMGDDDWCRPVYKGNDGQLFKDTNMISKATKKCDKNSFCTSDGFFDEPDTPMAYIKKYESIEVELKF